MNRMLRTSLVVAALALATAAAAGTKMNFPVTINASGKYVTGSVGSARNTADTIQYIGCQVAAVGATAARMICFARDAAGTYVSCTSAAPAYVAVAQSINPDSYVFFGWDVSGSCTFVQIAETSFYAPKQP